jgi:hypothetical protein
LKINVVLVPFFPNGTPFSAVNVAVSCIERQRVRLARSFRSAEWTDWDLGAETYMTPITSHQGGGRVIEQVNKPLH